MAIDPAALTPMPHPVLIGDIGGTNARFALIAEPGAAPQGLVKVPTAAFPEIESAIAASVLADGARPRSAVFAVAAPIEGEAIDLTNADWLIRPRDTVARFGLDEAVLVNDFEAQALALTALGPGDLHRIGGETGDGRLGAAKVVLGPGTGLGVAGLVPAGDIWTPVPGEGGHVSFGPAEADEFPLWAEIEPDEGRISAEALLSGPGMMRLYRAVARLSKEEPCLADPAAITEAGLAGSDGNAVRTLELYARFLGRLAGDLALIFLAHGGVYLAGGIAPRILPFLEAGHFRRAFEAKAPHGAIMRTMPSWVVTRDSPALLGLAAFAAAPGRFGMDLARRRWTA